MYADPARPGSGPARAAGSEPDRATAPVLLRPVPRVRPLAFSICVIATLVAEALALFLDAGIAHGAASLPRGQVRVWSFITAFGTSGYKFAISALIAIVAWTARRYANSADHRRRLTASMEGALFFFGCIAASGIAAQAIKHVVGRMRPRFLTEVGAFDFLGPTLHRGANSFPSGHTTSAFAAAMALGLIAPRLRVPLFVFAILIAVSRVATGNHFPSDVLAGAALGVGVSWSMAISLARRRVLFRVPGSDG